MTAIHRYDRVSIWLHWTVASMVLAQFATGWAWGLFERGSEPRLYLFRTHIAIGSVILATMLVRLGWRLGHAAPPLPAGTPRLQRLAAHATHGLLYAAILVQPVLGLVAITAFGKTLGPLPRVAHGLLSWAILAVVLLHVSAALWHHFVKRDGLLSRMAFRRDAAGA